MRVPRLYARVHKHGFYDTQQAQRERAPRSVVHHAVGRLGRCGEGDVPPTVRDVLCATCERECRPRGVPRTSCSM